MSELPPASALVAPLFEHIEPLLRRRKLVGTRAIKLLLSRPRTDFSGKYYRLENAACYPKPVQSHVPIWIGDRGEKRTLRIAARHADGWNVPYIGVDEFAHKCQVLDDWCEREGRNPGTIERGINLGFYMAPSAATVAEHAEKLDRQWGCTGSRTRRWSTDRLAAGSDRAHCAVRRGRRHAVEHRHPPAGGLGGARCLRLRRSATVHGAGFGNGQAVDNRAFIREVIGHGDARGPIACSTPFGIRGNCIPRRCVGGFSIAFRCSTPFGIRGNCIPTRRVANSWRGCVLNAFRHQR